MKISWKWATLQHLGALQLQDLVQLGNPIPFVNEMACGNYKWTRSFSEKLQGFRRTSLEELLGLQRNRKIAGIVCEYS